jgi:hypothetical protein
MIPWERTPKQYLQFIAVKKGHWKKAMLLLLIYFF